MQSSLNLQTAPLDRAGMGQKSACADRTSNSCSGFTACTQQKGILGLVKHSLTGICHAVFAHFY